MDPVKIVIFVAAFVLLFLVGRILASAARRADDPLQSPHPSGVSFPVTPVDNDGPRNSNRPALVGSEIAFPIPLPTVEQRPDGSYNRPEIRNYFFLKTDLLLGPADHNCLFDELRIETHDLGSDRLLTYQYTVATLSGLRQTMQLGHLASLYLDTQPVVIVERWDLKLILETVIDQMISDYTGEQHEARKEEAQAERSGG